VEEGGQEDADGFEQADEVEVDHAPPLLDLRSSSGLGSMTPGVGDDEVDGPEAVGHRVPAAWSAAVSVTSAGTASAQLAPSSSTSTCKRSARRGSGAPVAVGEGEVLRFHGRSLDAGVIR
jgi:hypothetical protein